MLDGEERERCQRLAQAADRARFVTGRMLARAVLAPLLDREPGQVRFALDCPRCGGRHGKPYVPGVAVRFSLSHSGAWVVLAVLPAAGAADATPAPDVGVDVQQVRPHLAGTAPLAFSSRERAWLDRAPEQRRDEWAARYWARKEAVLKATGLGITAPMSSFEVSPPHRQAALTGGSPRWAGLTMALADLRCPHPGYAAAVAIAGAVAVTVDEYPHIDPDGVRQGGVVMPG
jgi:4'-phosphopantetheinyl transferase